MKKQLLCGLLAAALLCRSAQSSLVVPVQVGGERLAGTSRLDIGLT